MHQTKEKTGKVVGRANGATVVGKLERRYAVQVYSGISTMKLCGVTLSSTEGKQNLPFPKFAFWDINYFKLIIFKRFYLLLGRGEGREGQKHQCAWLPLTHPFTGDPPGNTGMCPDWESNQRSFNLQAGTQSTEPHQPGYKLVIVKKGKDSGRTFDLPPTCLEELR